MNPDRTSVRSRQRGMGIVEVMVGILIGMIVVIAVYNVFAVAEGYKRTAIGAADAQTTGLFAQFVLAREIANAGNGLSGAGRELATCTNADPGWPTPPSFVAAPPPVRPVPTLILDGGGANTPDSLIVTYSTAPRVISPMLFIDKPMVALGDTFYIQSPNGFKVNDRVIAVDMNGNCELTRVTAVTPGDSTGVITTGVVGLSHPATANLYVPGGGANGSRLINLGQVGQAARTLFDVVNGQLRTTDLFGAAPAVPIAQNVVLMKAQYGVDCLSNGTILWTTATDTNICGDGLNYKPDDLTNSAIYNAPTLARIRAIRIGIVVRSDEPDLKLPMDPSVASGTRAPVILFNCSANTNALCPGRTVLPAGPVVALGSDNCAPAIICDTWRYRSYETVVPMINAIYNNGT